MKLILNQHLIGGYLVGTIRAPDPLTNHHEDQHLLEDVTNAQEAWDTLCECHKKVGPIAQILLIQEVFAKCYSRGQHFSLTSSELSKLVHHIYRIGIPTEEVFLLIAMLNALLGELSGVQTQVTSLLSSSLKDFPFTSANIHTHLNTEQQLLDNEKAQSANIALAASTTCMRHGNKKAVGGMAVQHDEVLARIHAEKSSRQNKANSQLSSGTSTPKSTPTISSVPHSIHYDNSSHTYIIDSVTGGAIFLASAPPMPTPIVSPVTSEFAGLACNSTPESSIHYPQGSNQSSMHL
ncbi:hypothetical protein PAXRUDRAFT_13924 [Paxillus rubicundulus Ve08.2h10]|uniref:Uncharacterized protein n=1 Tax=Paxillus rubicundulus Ve08.2h10 TaxID=930991 RepID=A0A0D0DXM8_9AGAM|nr:hypothetical protein PAXRUDRAFT_13924 [Paxillus rubicundulus Ve08.2h10]